MIVDKGKLNHIHTITYYALFESNSSIVRTIAEGLIDIKGCSYDVIVNNLCGGIEDEYVQGIDGCKLDGNALIVENGFCKGNEMNLIKVRISVGSKGV